MAQLWRALVLTESQDSVSKAQAHQSLYLWLQGLWGPLLACLGTCTQVTYTYTQVHTHKIKHFLKGRKKKSHQSLVCYPPPTVNVFLVPRCGSQSQKNRWVTRLPAELPHSSEFGLSQKHLREKMRWEILWMHEGKKCNQDLSPGCLHSRKNKTHSKHHQSVPLQRMESTGHVSM